MSTAWRACARLTGDEESGTHPRGSRLRALAGVVVPLLKKSLAGSWILVFIPATRELSTAIFLVGAKTRVISVMLLDLSETGKFETLRRTCFFLLGVTILIVLAGYKFLGRVSLEAYMNNPRRLFHQAPADLPATDLPRLALDEVSCVFGPSSPSIASASISCRASSSPPRVPPAAARRRRCA